MLFFQEGHHFFISVSKKNTDPTAKDVVNCFPVEKESKRQLFQDFEMTGLKAWMVSFKTEHFLLLMYYSLSCRGTLLFKTLPFPVEHVSHIFWHIK